jgi:hypothetical protein
LNGSGEGGGRGGGGGDGGSGLGGGGEGGEGGGGEGGEGGGGEKTRSGTRPRRSRRTRGLETPSRMSLPENHSSCISARVVVEISSIAAAASSALSKSSVAVAATEPGITERDTPAGVLPIDVKCAERAPPNGNGSKSLTSPPTVNVTSTPDT